MSSKQFYRRVLLVLAIAWLVMLALVLHSRYRATRAPAVPFVSGKCGDPALVAHWKFDEVSRGLTPDAGPYGHHGELARAPRALAAWRIEHPKLVTGRHGSALEFAGAQWVMAENNDCFASEQFTVAAWVWLSEPHGVPTIAAKSRDDADGWWLCTTSFGAQNVERYVDFGITLKAGGTMHVKSGYQLPLREWHHVVASLDNVRGEAQFFIDGVRFGPTRTGIPKWLINRDQNLFLAEYDGTGRWPWRGKLDDVRFYNYVIGADEVRSIFAQHGHPPTDARKDVQ